MEGKHEKSFQMINEAKKKEYEGAFSEAEELLRKVLAEDETENVQWTALYILADNYINRKLYLKAEKMAKKMISIFPNNYEGYHLCFLIHIEKDDYEKAEKYLTQIPEAFFEHPGYLMDYIAVLEKQERKEELLCYLKESKVIAEKIPRYALRKEAQIFVEQKEFAKAEKVLILLSKYFADGDALLLLMLIYSSKGEYMKSIKLGNVILQDTGEDVFGMQRLFASYFQMFNFYFVTEGRPGKEVREWIEKAGDFCIRFADIFGEEFGREVSVGVTELFSQINQNMKELAQSNV